MHQPSHAVHPLPGLPLTIAASCFSPLFLPQVREFHEALARSSDMAVAVAAIQALTTVIKNSSAQVGADAAAAARVHCIRGRRAA